MKNFLRLTDYSIEELTTIFSIADDIPTGKYKNVLQDKTVIMFFPASSIRTRVTFEKGIHLLGGQTILFPTETLDKKEAIQDVIGYLNNWANLIIVRHKDIALLEAIAKHALTICFAELMGILEELGKRLRMYLDFPLNSVAETAMKSQVFSLSQILMRQ